MASIDFLDDPYGNQSPGGQAPTWPTQPSAPSTPTGYPSMKYGGKADQNFINTIYGPGYSLQNGTLSYSGQGTPFWGQTGQENAAYLNSLADPYFSKDYQKFFSTLMGGSGATQYNLQHSANGNILQQLGFHITGPNASGQISKVQLPGHDPNNQNEGWVRVIEGDPVAGGSWAWVPQGATSTGGYTSQFSDPSTKQLEDYVGQYLGSLQGQREKLQQAFPIDRLIEFLNGRVNQLQGPAYTPQQQQILQTQLWEPIEQQRSAQHQRDLNYASAHGWGQDSGVTKALSNQTDQAFNQIRAGAQGQEAYREIGQQQANQNQAQQILMSLYGMGNDLQQQGLPLSSLLYQLPANAQQQALAALGMAPSPQDLYQQALQLYGIQNQQRNQNASWYAGLGQLLGYLT